LNALFRAATQSRIVKAALKVALLVGTILNVLNQGGGVLDGTPISWLQVATNYLVPLCVSSYSAARNELAHRHT